jgi:transcriptional regulator with XRE-family HTH domain
MFRGDRLKQLREQKGYTFDELESMTGLARSSLYRYEKGQNDPTAEIILKFAKLYGVTTDYLLDLTDDPNKHITFDDLSEMERKFIIAVRQKRIIEATESFAALAKGDDEAGVVTHDPAVNG